MKVAVKVLKKSKLRRSSELGGMGDAQVVWGGGLMAGVNRAAKNVSGGYYYCVCSTNYDYFRFHGGITEHAFPRGVFAKRSICSNKSRMQQFDGGGHENPRGFGKVLNKRPRGVLFDRLVWMSVGQLPAPPKGPHFGRRHILRSTTVVTYKNIYSINSYSINSVL